MIFEIASALRQTLGASVQREPVTEYGKRERSTRATRSRWYRIRRIADHLHVSASNVTADVGKLVTARYPTKVTDPEDVRAMEKSGTRCVTCVKELC